MADYTDFHQARSAKERQRAEALPPGYVRDLHNKLADLHRDMVLSLSPASELAASGGAHQQG